MMHLSRDKVLVVALHRQRPDQDAVIVRRLYAAIRAHGDRLTRTVRQASGAEAANRFLDTGIDGVRFFERSSAMLWGPYDLATFYLADDVVSILRIGSSCGASAHDLVLGQLFGTDEENAGALRALLGRREEKSPLLVLFSRVKLNDAFLAVGGHLLRAAYAKHAHNLAREAAHRTGERLFCLAMDTWSSHELAFILLGDDPKTLLRLSGQIEGASLDDVWKAEPTLRESLLSWMKDLPPGGRCDNTPRSILRRWALGRREPADERPEKILQSARSCHLALAARSQLGVHLPSAATQVEAHWAGFPALKKAVQRSIDIMQPGSTIGDAPRHEDLLEDIAGLRKGLHPHEAEPGELPISASIQWSPKPGHVNPVYRAVRELANALSLSQSHVRLGTGGRTTSVSLTVEMKATEAGCMLLHAITLWLRVDPKLSGHISDTFTTVELLQHAAPETDAGHVDLAPPPSAPHSLPPEPRSTVDASGLANARGYLLFEYPRTEESARFEAKRLQALGVGTAESLAIQSLFATVQHTLAQPEMFGAMLDISNVCKELALDLCHAEDIDRENLFDDLRALIQYTQLAYQQRLQFSAVVEGAPAIAGEVPYGISQLVEMVSGVAAVILHLPRIALGDAAHDSRRPRAPIVLLSPEAAVAMRGIRSFGVFVLSSAQAMTPMSLYLLFHELGHWMVRFWRSPEELRARKEALRDFGSLLSKRVRSCGLPGEKEWPDDRIARHAGRMATFLDDILAHAAWRLLGCDGELDLFRTEFLSAPAMGIRTGDPLHDLESVLELWGETALHLLVQERLAENGDSLCAVLAESSRGAADSEESESEWWEQTIKESVARVLPFALAQIASVAGRTSEKEQEKLAGALFRETWRQAMLLGEVGADDHPLVDLLIDAPLRFFVQWQGRLREEERGLRAEHSTYSELRGACARGDLPPSPPWTLLDEEGEPSAKAFLWVRAILSGVADHFRKECEGRSRHGVIRDKYNRSRPGTPNEGIYADFLGGLYRVGREARSRCLKVHATALHALEEVSYRVRAGRIDRYFRHQRSFPRRGAGYPMKVVKDHHEYECTVLDTSPVGLGLRLSEASKKQILEGTLVPLAEGDRVFVRTQHEDVAAIVKWRKADSQFGRLGLHVDGAEMLFEVHWGRSE